ncbi:MAG: NAC domain-containing protein, partial [Halobacteriales archaeon]
MFGGGGGGLNPRKMQQMMEQMGVDFDEIDATEVVMRLSDGSELYFEDPDVNRIVAQGQETYQVVGEPA